jgi:hypothetical protein
MAIVLYWAALAYQATVYREKLMFGSGILLPVIGMIGGISMGMYINPAYGWVWNGAIGFGAGCLILALVMVLFELLKRYASR